MKRTGLFIFVFLLSVSCFSQEWKETTIESDELKGTPAYTVNTFVNIEEKGSFTFWNIKEDDFRINSLNNIFKSNGQKGYNRNNLVVGLVGFYNEQDVLIEKLDKFPFEEDGLDQMNQIHPNRYTLKGGNNKKKAKQIIDYIKKEKGYVRFVLPLYRGGNLDLKVSCINNNNY